VTDAPGNVTTARGPGNPEVMPARSTDNIEAAAAWLLIALGLVAAALSLMIGAGVYHDGMRRVGLEAGDRTRVEAVVLAAGPRDGQYGRLRPSVPAVVPVRYSGLDGVEYVVDARLRGPASAGTLVPVWLDDTSTVVAAPRHPFDVIWDAVTAALGVLALGGLVLGAIWAVVRAGVHRANLAGWGREWAQVEPRWSGRAQR
jgi:hypothetical protein